MSTFLLVMLIGLSILATLSFLYPGFLAIATAVRSLVGWHHRKARDDRPARVHDLPSVTVIVPVHEAALDHLPGKLTDLARLDYPSDRLNILVAGDGVRPEALELHPNLALNQSVTWFTTVDRLGKNETLNRAVEQAQGEFLIFSDVTGRLDVTAVRVMVDAMSRPGIGGACGRLVIVDSGTDYGGRAATAQLAYWKMEDFIRDKEMALLGSVTSTTGKICAIRRELFDRIPPSATDDLFIALNVVSKGFEFISVPSAIAFISPPSKDQVHEMVRRRRIVTRSFGSMWYNKAVFLRNPAYGFCLFVHKVLRRLFPFILMFVFLISLGLQHSHPLWEMFVYLQLVLASLFLFAVLAPKLPAPANYLRYLAAAGTATALGVIDFLFGRSRPNWE